VQRPLVVCALAVLVAASFIPAGAARAAPLVTEDTFLTVAIGGKPYRLQALITKEVGSVPLPVALVTHGMSADVEQRQALSPAANARLARDLARRGWLAVAVVRRGFGQSVGPTPYSLRQCPGVSFAELLDDQTDDVAAALAAIGKRPDADGTRMIAIGASVGGAVVLNLAARAPEGLRAVVNVSGGLRMSMDDGVPAPETCAADDLLPVFAAYGAKSRLPTLWIYAENDLPFPGPYVRKLHEAYVGAGGRSEFHMFDPISDDGHNIFGTLDGARRWMPVMDKFLASHALPTFDQKKMDAAITALHLSRGARDVARQYPGWPTEKALAVSSTGKTVNASYGYPSIEEAAAKSLAECQKLANEPCRVALINFDAVETPR
jgi:pimeloyl-ACP methyl ester carboxylesterase